MKGDLKLEICIQVNTKNMKLDDKKILRDTLQKYVDELNCEIKHQHIANHKHN